MQQLLLLLVAAVGSTLHISANGTEPLNATAGNREAGTRELTTWLGTRAQTHWRLRRQEVWGWRNYQ
jgi:hypothetical protein